MTADRSMNRPIRRFAPFFAVLSLAACGSSPPVHYYSLDPLEITYEPDPEGAPVLDLGPLRMPDYVSRRQMVSRGRGTEVIVDDFNRWAEPLDETVHRIVALNVDSLVDGVIVVAYPNRSPIDSSYRLHGSITRFDAGQDGRAVLIVQWGIVSADGEVVVAPRRSRYEAQASRRNDAAEMARALNDTISQFSRDIAGRIEAEKL